ncbi:MAG: ATP-binding protein [Gammaproteobacteria bacterium]|nr:ATP-binding protein [Gammaproteobacteria bacterium]
MKLEIERPFIDSFLEEFPDLTALQEQLRFGDKAEVHFRELSTQQISYLEDLYQKAGPEMRSRAAQLSTLRNAVNDDTERFGPDDLEQLVPAFARYLIKDAIRGWLFSANGSDKPLAYVVSRLDFTPGGEEETAKLLIELKANAKAKMATKTLTIRSKDIENKTISEILAEKGYVKETVELISAYDEIEKCYFAWRSQYGKQFSGKGIGYFAEDPTSTHRNTDWSRKNIIVLSTDGNPTRLVNDESILSDRTLTLETTGDVLGKYVRKAGNSARYNADAEAEAEQAKIPEGLFTALPVHAYILMFHLELHHHVWVHVEDMELYEYKPQLKQKLILPEEQTDLIDILTAEMDVLMDDIVAGKSGGTTVLCAGPPGVGKTLTAEVYSEIIQRPLYRVHSGQLGLNVSEMEKALKDTLTRAQRWGAVMLIDEADVYIKRRDDNIASNAVVGVFLRVLEYFNGLLFLTTNRVDDIDEAIISRCIAIIKYHPPGVEDRKKIWQVMTRQFELQVADDLIQTLVELFPSATGRDIKGLSKLVAKYCQHKQAAPDIDVFKRCSIFRGMELQHEEIANG